MDSKLLPFPTSENKKERENGNKRERVQKSNTLPRLKINFSGRNLKQRVGEEKGGKQSWENFQQLEPDDDLEEWNGFLDGLLDFFF